MAHTPQVAAHVGARAAQVIHSGTPAQLALWADQAINAAGYAKIPVQIEWGIFGAETRFGTYIGTSSTGAMGLMQFEPATAVTYHYPMTDYPDQAQSQNQFTAGALYMRDLFRKHGDWNSAILAYSGGAYSLAHVQSLANSRPLPGASKPGGTPGRPDYVNPLGAAHVIPERIDQGVDYAPRGGNLLAIADCVITTAAAPFSGWPGNAVIYRITQAGPLDGMFIGYMEGVRPLVHRGQAVQGGQPVAGLINNWPTGIELAVMNDGTSGVTWARNHGGFDGSHSTVCGFQFSTLIGQLGGPQGIQAPGNLMGQVNPQLAAILNSPGQLHNVSSSPFTLETIVGTGSYGYLVTDYDSSGDIAHIFQALQHGSGSGAQVMRNLQRSVTGTHYITNKGRH